MSLSRRHLLTGAVALPLAACTQPAEPAPVDPDALLRDAARQRERDLLASYDALMAATPALAPRLAPLRAEHEEHLAQLAPVASAAPGSSAVTTLAQLVALEKQMAAAHAADALRASRPLAVVLASLAASEASHPVALA